MTTSGRPMTPAFEALVQGLLAERRRNLASG